MITLLTNVTNNAEPAKYLLKAAPLSYKQQYLQASLDGYHAAFAFSLVFAVIGVVLTFFLKDHDHEMHTKGISSDDFKNKGGDAA